MARLAYADRLPLWGPLHPLTYQLGEVNSARLLSQDITEFRNSVGSATLTSLP